MPVEESATISGPSKEHITFRYFYALDGDVLIPIRRDSIGSLIVKH